MIAYLEDSPSRATKEDETNYVMNKKISGLVFKSVSDKIPACRIPACRKLIHKSRYLVSFPSSRISHGHVGTRNVRVRALTLRERILLDGDVDLPALLCKAEIDGTLMWALVPVG